MKAKENTTGGDGAVLKVESNALLDLLSAQINSALSDLESPQQELTKFFHCVVSDLEKVRLAVLTTGTQNSGIESIDQMLENIKLAANKAVVEFQSFDKVEQRLKNARESLHVISDHTDLEKLQSDEYVDEAILERIKAIYSLEHELTLHQMMEGGSDRTQMLKSSSSTTARKSNDDIELF